MSTPAPSRRIAIVQGHPDGADPHLCHALAEAYAAAARQAGHAVREIDLAMLDFPLLRRRQDFEAGALPPALEPAAEAILWCEHLVLIFPLWLGTMPALVKAFLEHVMRPGLAFDYAERGARGRLGGRSARIVVTMAMPAFIYRFFYCAHGVRGLARSILNFVGMRPVRLTLLGMVEQAGQARRAAWLSRAARLGARGA